MSQASNANTEQLRTPIPPSAGFIKCRRCGCEKEPDAYYGGHKKNGKESWCKACVLERKRLTRLRKLRKAKYMAQFQVIHNGQPDERLFVMRLKPVLEG